MYFNVCNKYWELKKKLKYHILKKTWSLSIVYSKCGCEYKKNI